jgi:hypothetical protein
MELKLFHASGKVETDAIEGAVNDWLADNPTIEIKRTETSAFGGLGGAHDSAQHRGIVISIWYERP